MYERGFEMEGLTVEQERPAFVVTRISDGFEFGDGAISGEDEAPEVLAIVDRTIETAPDVIVPIDHEDDGQLVEDDGCGDGREAASVYKVGQTFKRSLNRAKVFGGSVAMAMAGRVGLGQAAGSQLNRVFDDSIESLTARGMGFGAHVDDHAEGNNCGCGAIDKAPEALQAAVKYETPIRGIVKALGVSDEGLDATFDNFRSYVDELPLQPSYRGKNVMAGILQAGKVVKRLTGPHRERRIVLNAVPGQTVNQQLIREATGDRAQIFGIDTWRMEDIANKLYAGDPSAQHQALLSELVYTLGVAAVLTKGDLPVYMVQAA